ncbi:MULTISPECIES: redox-sensitive transcriptional activator SoxR [unclassified Curtobacterium]|uniref:redox-sensitive transcriptional activator SoxR n=1 Tax=unclassified Curtobacterium TaxID=257496 RepID=UPI000DA954C6|nr:MULTISPECIES: redox-sensitive transcriptional activator SoxR [unclassified Curtobacterium]PZE23364.1 redox-sensitive transcriptional activator SoxR [Curtobacterium sp. MCBD17_028]PZE74785.1 redox-sensitive transcriptional activator SoxR [Curtobacterium sp. MCBD17_019]PZF62730.1 redox-sensitive transcriptional activator SoxR [Curtobacterium sp. MCBD17_013]WIB63167.1 redox-sensitive transcriptional activator SoxR [Curtobacterium sp. MCBD17_040]WIB67011.1 redox-sensitive transcriptional activa
MPTATDLLTIGELSRRSGIAPSAIRYYEERGLVTAERTAGNQRLFPRHTLRRLAVLAAGQRAGLSLAEIREAFDALPADRAPNPAEWTALSRRWADAVDTRIRELEALRDDLDGCIGCGCLSLTRCALVNPGDGAARSGPGPHQLHGVRTGSRLHEARSGGDTGIVADTNAARFEPTERPA